MKSEGGLRFTPALFVASPLYGSTSMIVGAWMPRVSPKFFSRSVYSCSSSCRSRFLSTDFLSCSSPLCSSLIVWSSLCAETGTIPAAVMLALLTTKVLFGANVSVVVAILMTGRSWFGVRVPRFQTSVVVPSGLAVTVGAGIPGFSAAVAASSKITYSGSTSVIVTLFTGAAGLAIAVRVEATSQITGLPAIAEPVMP